MGGGEQRRIQATVSRVAGGEGAALLIGGESGIGKTRLARYALQLAEAYVDALKETLDREPFQAAVSTEQAMWTRADAYRRFMGGWSCQMA